MWTGRRSESDTRDHHNLNLLSFQYCHSKNKCVYYDLLVAIDPKHLPEDPKVLKQMVLDLMAQLAGMRLRERWNNWKREPYTGTASQVSVYEHAGG